MSALLDLRLPWTRAPTGTEANEMDDQGMLGAGEPGTSQPGIIRGERFWRDILLTTDKHTMER